MNNPLLGAAQLPAFHDIRPEYIEPAIRDLLDANRKLLTSLLDSGAQGWDGIVAPIEHMQHRLARAWSPVGHLNGVLNSDALRAAYNACLPLLTAYHTELAQNERLYVAYQRVADAEYASLPPAGRKLLDNALRDFRLAGVALEPAQKQRFGELMERVALAQAKFDENVLDATNAWSRDVDSADELAGLPQSVIDRASAAAQAAGKTGWLFTLDAPNYQAVLAHSGNRELRHAFYEAWVTRASELGAPQWDNTALMEEILGLRHQIAQLVGFASFAEYSLATKMARDPAEVLDFLRRLAHVTRLQRSANLPNWKPLPVRASRRGTSPINRSDSSSRGSRSRKKNCVPTSRCRACSKDSSRSRHALRHPYRATRRRRGLSPRRSVLRLVDADGARRGGFFLDLYARPRKRGGAWMDECVGRIRLHDATALPVAYLVCNFTPPGASRPALLTHYEVLTMFHEFGHGLHHMLTRVDFPSVAGINGVPWDAVELPSQFMENFAWREEVLPLSRATSIPGNHCRSRCCVNCRRRDLPGGHADRAPARILAVRLPDPCGVFAGARRAHSEILAEVRDEVAVVRPPEFNRFPHSFQHIFSGGYAAGYYSYKWAEVLSADAFAAFEEAGMFDPAIARRFLQSILERGGSRDAMDAFVEFR